MGAADSEKQENSLEQRVTAVETKLEEFDQVVFASISQILAAVGQSGTLTERVRQIETAVQQISQDLELASTHIGDARLIDSIKRSTDEIKTALGIR